MNKGYILPVVLIVLLLGLASFFFFTPVQTFPIAEKTINILQDNASSSVEDIRKYESLDIGTTTEDFIEEISTSTEEDSF